MSKHELDQESEQALAPKSQKRQPTKQETVAIDKAVAYCRSRTQPLAYEITRMEGGDIKIKIPHDNPGGFMAQERATFGTVSEEFARRAAADVGDIVRARGEKLPAPDKMNAGIAAVAGIEPQNEYEAMLAVQMVGTHSVAMDMLARAKQADSTDQLERFGTLAVKLLRTYTAQIEALAKLRRGGEQKVRVEHVHVYQGGQAIVGNVTTGKGGGLLENGNQPHALTGPAAFALPDGTAVLREDPSRDPVPVASRGREGQVPDARRRARKRRAEG